jgi:tetratricopeptide (TPR) repeat protein
MPQLKVATKVLPRPPKFMLGQMPSADEIREQLREHPEGLDASVFRLVMALVLEDSLGEALEVAAASVQREPEDAPRHILLAQVLDELGRAEEAADEYAEALRLGLRDPAGRISLRMGDLLHISGRHVEAREAWRQALEYAEDRPDTVTPLNAPEVEIPLPGWARLLMRITTPTKRQARWRLRQF